MPNFWARPKVDVHFTQKDDFHFSKFGFCGTKCNQIFGPAQKIWAAKKLLGPVEGHGING